MVWTHPGRDIPLEIYHGIPSGWSANDLVAEHSRLGGVDDISVGRIAGPRPDWLPQRSEWLRYRETLYRISDGVTSGDLACIELAVRFIELRYIGSYSGFIREKLARRLRSATINSEQRLRLHNHFRMLVLRGERTQEFRDYMKLWRTLITAEEREETLHSVRSERSSEAAEWLASRLSRTAP
jgi:hypothetical protein